MVDTLTARPSVESQVGYDQAVSRRYDFDAFITIYQAPSVLLKAIRHYVRPETRILEGGVGTGYFAKRLRRLGAEVYGMDISSDMLKNCWAWRFQNGSILANIKSFGVSGLFGREKICTALIKADMEGRNWPIKSKSMDGIVVCGAMEWIRNPKNLIAEAARVLKDGGFFAITFVHEQSGENVDGRHNHSTILDLMKKCGMAIVDDRPFTENYASNCPNRMVKHRAVVGIKLKDCAT